MGVSEHLNFLTGKKSHLVDLVAGESYVGAIDNVGAYYWRGCLA